MHSQPGYDTENGPYGTSGIYRAVNFYDEEHECYRSGMGIHSGRANKDFEDRITNGCIRVEQDTMDEIDKYTSSGYKWTTITITSTTDDSSNPDQQ